MVWAPVDIGKRGHLFPLPEKAKIDKHCMLYLDQLPYRRALTIHESSVFKCDKCCAEVEKIE